MRERGRRRGWLIRFGDEVDPELVPRHTTAYWVGDDPCWAGQRLDDPGLPGVRPAAAHEDVQVARALELGKHLGRGPKPWLVVSNNVRNHYLDTVVAARITTTGKNASCRPLSRSAAGTRSSESVRCDDLVQLYGDELGAHLGTLLPSTMQAKSAGLRIALP